jgi:hypothetical protein
MAHRRRRNLEPIQVVSADADPKWLSAFNASLNDTRANGMVWLRCAAVARDMEEFVGSLCRTTNPQYEKTKRELYELEFTNRKERLNLGFRLFKDAVDLKAEFLRLGTTRVTPSWRQLPRQMEEFAEFIGKQVEFFKICNPRRKFNRHQLFLSVVANLRGAPQGRPASFNDIADLILIARRSHDPRLPDPPISGESIKKYFQALMKAAHTMPPELKQLLEWLPARNAPG